MVYDEQEFYKGYEIITRPDYLVDNPRVTQDNLFQFIGGDRNHYCPENSDYKLSGNIWIDAANFYGNEFEPEQAKEAESWVEENLFYYKIYFHDHSYYSLHFSKIDPWDSGLFGLLCVKYDRLFAEYNVDKLDSKIITKLGDIAQRELDEYQAYLNNDFKELSVYRDGNRLGAAGYIRPQELDADITLLKKDIDKHIEKREQASVAKLKELIASKMPIEKIPAILHEVYNEEPCDFF
ncbi:MAG: hypothetical protein [Caudoviricetes sp.]|nr:MAG: hypothetical protein [Caudoviricetes sp.]